LGLRDTYAHAIQTAKGKFHGNAEERDGKLYFKGTVATDAEKNELWTAIKTISTWETDVVADIQVTGPAAAPPGVGKTHIVKVGDTLGAIAQQHLGNAGDYMKIFEANRDQLTNPDRINPGQVLRLP
jgi:nucleoid-associated protein YgaU